ncbi:immunoglobulin domain-containing protein [Paucibacter sp. O1-1]|nr:immunoglobulin domain-containing protein [Paucibacter sp. O1-1]MDA3829934.1 immunoglobulin domain-containing protein [Paucibacter sp. O1-1]
MAPSISVQPLGLSAQSGNAVVFSVVASGNPAPSYQWRRNGTAIAGATAASYTSRPRWRWPTAAPATACW